MGGHACMLLFVGLRAHIHTQIQGRLTHKDSMGNVESLGRGGVQYLSAGTGIRHSEHNTGDPPLRFIQSWVVPDRSGHKPRYGQFDGDAAGRKNSFQHLVSSMSNQTANAPVQIHQGVWPLHSLSLHVPQSQSPHSSRPLHTRNTAFQTRTSTCVNSMKGLQRLCR